MPQNETSESIGDRLAKAIARLASVKTEQTLREENGLAVQAYDKIKNRKNRIDEYLDGVK